MCGTYVTTCADLAHLDQLFRNGPPPSRMLTSDELVHHKDENKQNNAVDNLELTTRAWHKVMHRVRDKGRRLPDEENPVITCRCGCEETFPKFDDHGRPRVVVPGHNRTGRHPKRDAVLSAIRDGVTHQVEIAKRLGRGLSTVRSDIAQLVNDGLVEKSGPATWSLRKEAA